MQNFAMKKKIKIYRTPFPRHGYADMRPEHSEENNLVFELT